MRLYLWMLGHELETVAHRNYSWMSWNLFLAFVPVVLAFLLFHRPHQRTFLWWAGVVAFVLFLPNAPYILTDLIHLRTDFHATTLDGTVVLGVLPLYAFFVASGIACYSLALREVNRAVLRSPWAGQATIIQVVLHAACAVGVLLGRVPPRINSWSVVTHPHIAASAVTRTLTHPGSPLLVLALFATIWLVHASTQVAAHVAHRTWVDHAAKRPSSSSSRAA